jgi:integrase
VNRVNLRIVVNNERDVQNITTTFIKESHKISDEAFVVKTTHSGKYYHLRMRVKSEGKYFRKSLKTTHLDTALERAKLEVAKVIVNVEQGRKVFASPIYSAVEEYLTHRATEIRQAQETHGITSGRWSTLKSHLKHFSAYTQAEGRLGNSAVTRLDSLDENSLLGYAKYRRSHPFYAKEITIRNEQATINAFCKWAYKKGLHNTESFDFVKISMRRTDKDEIRRATYTDAEYKRLHLALRSYTAKNKLIDAEELFERQLVRHFVLISANTMMRFGELYQLKWGNVKTLTVEGKRLARISVKGETSKVGQSREITVRGGEYFDRLKELGKHTKNSNFVFTRNNGQQITKDSMYKQYPKVMKLAEIDDWKERNLTYYSLRHYGITKRVQSGAPILPLSLICGTSVNHIQNTYYHSEQQEQIDIALGRYKPHNYEEELLEVFS